MEPIQNETNKTLAISERVRSVTASDQLVHRLRQIPTNVRERYEKVPKRVVWAVAASIAVLIVLNVLSARNYTEQNAIGSNETPVSYFDYLKTL